MTHVRIQVQTDDFDLAQEYQRIRQQNPRCGAIVSFTGLVRDFNADGAVESIFLEHYPAMTGKILQQLADRAIGRWPLGGITIIHRVGLLRGSEQIVLVLVAAEHRGEAFAAAEYLMDFLKTEAPFWKREDGPGGKGWVEAKTSDQRARERWEP